MKNSSSSFVTTFNLSKKGELEAELKNLGFALTRPPHTVFSGKKPGISCTLYASGKLLVQGSKKDEFIEFVLESRFIEGTPFTYPAKEATHSQVEIGCDEAGKGDFFGPLCISGLYADKNGLAELKKLGVNDSKKISDDKILSLARVLRKQFESHTIILLPPKYNELYTKIGNLNHMLAWAHASIIETLAKKTGAKSALVDQFAKGGIVANSVRKKGVEIEVFERTRAESDPIVAGASILARAAFVESMDSLSKSLGERIPKGAGALVKKFGRDIYHERGIQVLNSICKTHFKTHGEITGGK